jgi:uncharacterized protein (TIGR02145 family)
MKNVIRIILMTMAFVVTISFFTACGDEKISSDISNNQKYKTFTDPRDGQKYKIVKIKNQVWMAENLNYNAENSECYYKNNCVGYGRYYRPDSKELVCPEGWRLPTRDDFEELFDAVGGYGYAGRALKSSNGWFNNGNGTDAFGFNAQPLPELNVNYRYNGGGIEEAFNAIFWCVGNCFMFLDYRYRSAHFEWLGTGLSKPSIRCIQNRESH